MKKRYILLFFIVIFGVIFWILYTDSIKENIVIDTPPAPNGNSLDPQPNEDPIKDLIILDTPVQDQKISSPLVIKGKARGNWYFEASFPVVLTDWDGKILAQSYAEAQGEWMTENFVPFTLTLPFPAQPAGSYGFLILKKDNPSGDPALDKSLEIKVAF